MIKFFNIPSIDLFFCVCFFKRRRSAVLSYNRDSLRKQTHKIHDFLLSFSRYFFLFFAIILCIAFYMPKPPFIASFFNGSFVKPGNCNKQFHIHVFTEKMVPTLIFQRRTFTYQLRLFKFKLKSLKNSNCLCPFDKTIN